MKYYIALIRDSHTQERPFTINLRAIRDAYSYHEICKVGFIRGPNNPADGLTKRGKCIALNHLLRTSTAYFKIDQWVLRKRDNLPVESSINCCQEQEINFQPLKTANFIASLF